MPTTTSVIALGLAILMFASRRGDRRDRAQFNPLLTVSGLGDAEHFQKERDDFLNIVAKLDEGVRLHNGLPFEEQQKGADIGILLGDSFFGASAENDEAVIIAKGVQENIKAVVQSGDDCSIQGHDFDNLNTVIGQSGEDRSDDHSDSPHIPINENIISLSQHDQTGGFQDDDSNYGSSVSTDQRMSRSSSFSDFDTESLEDESGYSHITKRKGGCEYHIDYPLTTLLDNSRDDNCQETMDESGYDSLSDSSEGEIELKRDGPQVQGEPIEQDSADEECDKTDIMSVWSNKNQLVDSDLDNIITSNECQSNPSSIDDMAISRINIIDHDKGDSISEEHRHLISIHLIDQSPVMINEQVRSVDGVDNGDDQEVTSSDNVLKADPISIDNGDLIPDHVHCGSSSIISTKPDHQLPVQQDLIRHHSSEQLSDNDYDWPSSTSNDKEQSDRGEDGRTSDIEYEGTKNDDEDVQGGVCEVDDQTDDDNQVVIEEMDLSPFIPKTSQHELSGQLFNGDFETSNDEEKSDKGDSGRRSDIEYEGEMRYSQIDDEDGQADDNEVDGHAGDSKVVSGIMGSPSLSLPKISQQELSGLLSEDGPSSTFSDEEENDGGDGGRTSDNENEGAKRYSQIDDEDGQAGDNEVVPEIMESPNLSLHESSQQELSTQLSDSFKEVDGQADDSKDGSGKMESPSVSLRETRQQESIAIESDSLSGTLTGPCRPFSDQVYHGTNKQSADEVSLDQSDSDNQFQDNFSDDRIREGYDDGSAIDTASTQFTSTSGHYTLKDLLILARIEEDRQVTEYYQLEHERLEKERLENDHHEDDRREKGGLEEKARPRRRKFWRRPKLNKILSRARSNLNTMF